MSVIHLQRGGLAFGTKSKVLISSSGRGALKDLEQAGMATVQPGLEETYLDIAMWGLNNQLPAEMACDIEKTGVLSAGVDAKARIAIGKGPMPARITGIDTNGYEQLEFIGDPGIAGFLEMHNSYWTAYSVTSDLFSMGNAWVQILLSRDRKSIAGFKRHDPVQCRNSRVDDKTGKSEWTYISADWNRWASFTPEEKKHITRVPLLDADYPLFDLQERTSGSSFMLHLHYPLRGRNYYSPAPWYAARQWVKIAQGIPAMKEAMFNNQITLKYLVEIHPGFWQVFDPTYNGATDAEKLAIQDKYYDGIDEYLTGGNNAYKSIFSVKLPNPAGGDPISAVTVTAVDDKIKDGKLLPDSAAANSEILFALMINPAMIGLETPGGSAVTGGSGSNIREAYLVQVMLAEAERQMNNKLYNIVKYFNGWPADVVTRYPNQILTTLNTGANTQPTA